MVALIMETTEEVMNIEPTLEMVHSDNEGAANIMPVSEVVSTTESIENNNTVTEESKEVNTDITAQELLVEKKVIGRPFPKGIGGNPKGKPKGARHFSTLIREAITKVAEGDAEPQDIIMVKALAKKAKAGDLKALDMVFDRVDGKAEQTINLDADIHTDNDFSEEEKRALLDLIQ